MAAQLPRLLIVSEVPFSQNGMGANRTLFNLFESYPRKHFMACAPDTYLKAQPVDPSFEQQVVPFPGHYLPIFRNRLSKLINPLLTAVNHQLMDWLPIANFKKIENFAPEVILVCPITSWGLLMGHKLSQHFPCPILIYFMDDWLAQYTLRWMSGNVQTIAYQLLKESAGWLMISEQLQADLSKRYQLVPRHSLIVHNPVDLSGKEPPKAENRPEGRFKVAYAGSIWPMHYDALAVVAEAIFQLRCDGHDIELVLYTEPCFWNTYQKKMIEWQVVYGSFIPYSQLYPYLKQADLLLVASSFLPEYYHVIRSSVLTKLTDYMVAGRPIFSCGPDYSACNLFLKKWDCGLVCETNQVKEVKELLLKAMRERSCLALLSQKAFQSVRTNFEIKYVTSNLYEFIKQISLASSSSKNESYIP